MDNSLRAELIKSRRFGFTAAFLVFSIKLIAQADETTATHLPWLPIKAAELASFADPLITAQMEKEHIPGAVFILVQNGQVLYQRGYGFADLAARKPVDPEKTIWRIGSISKVFTATAVVQLADRGRFRLTDDVNQYLTRFKVPATFPQPVRFWHLLTHTAGFDEIRPGTRADTQAGLLSSATFSHQSWCAPTAGQVISYSTTVSASGGYLVEQVSGMDFETYLSRNIWLPLGMTHTNIVVPDSLKPDLAIPTSGQRRQPARKLGVVSLDSCVVDQRQCG
jgi:CubicO group peptidase (beta-lactamase class C family)